MFRRPRKLRARKPALPDPSAQAIDALRRGPEDEKNDVMRSVVAPSAADLMRLPEWKDMYAFAKAQTQGVDRTPRQGVAMTQIDLGDTGSEHLMLRRPVGLDFAQLRAVARHTHPARLVIRRRIRQVERFLRQPAFSYEPGFEFRFRDKKRSVTDQDKARFDWLREYLMNCGAEFDPRMRRARQRDNLHEFVHKHLRDSLEMDAAPIEYVYTTGGNLHGFVHVDGAKVFLTDPNVGMEADFAGPAELNLLTGRTDFGNPRNITAVYVKDGRVAAQFTHMDMLYPVRNRSGQEEYFGYGDPETEAILKVGTAFLDAFTMNARNLNDNSIPRGAWSLIGDYQDEDIEELKANWMAELRGANNRFRTPIFATEAAPGAGLQFIPTGAQVDDAMFSRWMTLLTAIVCAEYLMDPSEIGFESFSPGGLSSLSGSDTEERLINSHDNGLRAILTWLESTLNEIIQIVDPEVEMFWTGLDKTKEEDAQQEQSIMTLREVRERHGMSNDDMDDGVLDALTSVAGQAYMSVLGNKQQQDMMAQQQAQGGQDDEGGAEDDPGAGEDGEGAQDGDALPNEEGKPGEAQPEPTTTPTDPEHPEGPNGEQRFSDRDGGRWQMSKAEQSSGERWAAWMDDDGEMWP